MTEFAQFSKFRLYFYDAKSGCELVDHPLNGVPSGQLGMAVASTDGRTLFKGTRMKARVRLCCNFARKVMPEYEGVDITTADFGGQTVKVKVWGPNGYSEHFYLITNDTPAWRVENPHLVIAA